jgi:hypothetical protein
LTRGATTANIRASPRKLRRDAMAFTFSDLIFAIDVTGDRDIAQFRLFDNEKQLVLINVVTCGRTNNPPNTLQGDADLAFGFANQDELDQLKAALKAVLEQLNNSVVAPPEAPRET